MQLKIKQRFFTFGDTYDIFNESGDPKYFVKQKMLALGKQIYVYDKGTGEEVGAIKEKLLAILPTFRAFIREREVGQVKRELSLISRRYSVDFLGWDVEGDILGLDYTVRQGDRVVMRVSQELFECTDTYVIDYSNPEDEIPALLLALTIDAVNSKND